MLKITVATHTESNITVLKDSVIDFDPYFLTEVIPDGESFKEQTSIIFKNKTWAKASDYKGGDSTQIKEVFKEYGPNYKVVLTDEQMTELENNTGEFENVFQGVQNIIIEAIESGWEQNGTTYTGVGEGNVIYYKAVFS